MSNNHLKEKHFLLNRIKFDIRTEYIEYNGAVPYLAISIIITDIPVLIVAIIHIERNEPESGPDEYRIEGAPSHRVAHRSGQPLPPLHIQFVVEPRYRTVRIVDVWWRKTVDRGGLVITQSWEDRSPRKHVGHLFDSFFDNFQILVTSLIPDVVRGQIARPQDVVYVLE